MARNSSPITPFENALNCLWALPVLLLLIGTLPSPAAGQLNAEGFVRNYNAVATTPDHALLVGRNRLRFNLENSFSRGELRISTDLRNDYSRSADSLSFRLREAYADLYFPNSDLRVGRQIISWGRTDGGFIADILTPLDLSEFLTQEFSDLRTGLTALSYTRYFGQDYLQLVASPLFQPNRTPRPGSRWFPRSFFSGELPTRFNPYRTQPTLSDIQLGARLALRSSLNYDLDLGVLYWNYPNPAYAKELLPAGDGTLQLTETFTQSLVLLLSGTLQLSERLLVTAEGAYYTDRLFDYLTPQLRNINYTAPSPSDRALLGQAFSNNSDGFLKRSPWFSGMAGVEYELAGWTAGLQLVDEIILDYGDQMLQNRHYTYLTLLLQRTFLREKLAFRGFARYNRAGEDYWINPELTYRGIDNIEASAGAQLFGGDDPEQFFGHLSFSNYAQNSFGYLRFTAYF